MKVRLANDLQEKLEQSQRVMLAVGPYLLRGALIFIGLLLCFNYLSAVW